MHATLNPDGSADIYAGPPGTTNGAPVLSLPAAVTAAVRAATPPPERPRYRCTVCHVPDDLHPFSPCRGGAFETFTPIYSPTPDASDYPAAQYLWAVEAPDGTEGDSCGGYYGDQGLRQALEDATDSAEYDYKAAVRRDTEARQLTARTPSAFYPCPVHP